MPERNFLNGSSFKHLPVLANQILQSLQNVPPDLLNEGLIIDATFGGGGHCAVLLKENPGLNALGIDQDPYAIAAASKLLLSFKNRLKVVKGNFSTFEPSQQATIIIADLGVSSPQLDIPERGFSFHLNGPLDMRMNQDNGITAAELIAKVEEKELADLIYKYGEEKFSRRIARKIKEDLLNNGPYQGTKDLAYAIAGCYPRKNRYNRIHPATRTFQALRIAVNDELNALEAFLKKAPDWLLTNGIINIISFHSLEDRLVKQAFKEDPKFERITRKPITAENSEITENPRSRSAKLRIAKKIKD